jgi:mono/diheme cytochrome c family protein
VNKFLLGGTMMSLLALGACKSSERANTSETSSFAQDPSIYDPSQGSFLKSHADHKEAAIWFEDIPLASSGIPMIMFRVFSDFAPKIWGNDMEDLSHLGLPRRTETKSFLNSIDMKRPALPVGMGYHRSQKKIIPLDITSVQVVGLTCAACHTGRVRLDSADTDKNENRDTSVRFLIGGTSQQFDPNAFGDAVYKTVSRSDFTGAKFRELIQKRQKENPGMWIFNDPLMMPQHILELEIFLNKKDEDGKYVSDAVVQAVKDTVLKRQSAIDKVLGPLYTKQVSSLYGGTPGQADALGKIAVISGAHPLAAAPVDLPTVWRQNTREYAQFDGSIRDPLFRNLAASFGVGGVAADVNVVNAYKVSDLVMELPQPKFPFAIDQVKAARGAQHFAKYCAACHGSTEANAPAKTVRTPFTIDQGASENRARQLDSDAIAKIAAGLKETCVTGQKRDSRTPLLVGSYIDVDGKRCEVDNNDILFDQSKTPGTVGQALAGIWSSAPYLHNGSVPNLRALLIPAQRPKTFIRGNLRYDKKNLGFVSDTVDAEFGSFDRATNKITLKTRGKSHPKPVANIAIYDTSLIGNKNGGHSTKEMLGGKDWEADREATDELLEYLKTI